MPAVNDGDRFFAVGSCVGMVIPAQYGIDGIAELSIVFHDQYMNVLFGYC
jgi:hypothetical protein